MAKPRRSAPEGGHSPRTLRIWRPSGFPPSRRKSVARDPHTASPNAAADPYPAAGGAGHPAAGDRNPDGPSRTLRSRLHTTLVTAPVRPLPPPDRMSRTAVPREELRQRLGLNGGYRNRSPSSDGPAKPLAGRRTRPRRRRARKCPDKGATLRRIRLRSVFHPVAPPPKGSRCSARYSIRCPCNSWVVPEEVQCAILLGSGRNSISMLDSEAQRSKGSLGYFEKSLQKGLASDWPEDCWRHLERTLQRCEAHRSARPEEVPRSGWPNGVGDSA